MKIFEGPGVWNFVDKNNVVVGYRNEKDCCEDFGYFFTREIPKVRFHNLNEVTENELENYNFDPNFFQENSFQDDSDSATAIFRLIDDKGNQVYLTLYNIHNGYYGHGFTMEIMGKIKHSGRL